MNVFLTIFAVIATAILGVIVDWLLKTRLPINPNTIHVIVGLGVCIVLVFIAVIPAFINEQDTLQNISPTGTQTSLITDIPTLTPTQSNQVGPTSTPNAYDLNIEALSDVENSVLESQIIDLDGVGPHEIIIRWEYGTIPEDIIALGWLDVYAWFDGEWQNVARIKELDNHCGPYWGEFGVINLFGDQTRQIATWLQCGTGSFLSLEIYKYQGLGFLERIYKSPDLDTETETQRWMESVPLIVNEQLYITHASELYKYSWFSNGVIGERTELNLGSSGVKVEYWIDDDGLPQASPNQVTLRIGQYLYLQALDDNNLPWDTRIQVCCDGSLLFDSSHLLKAEKEGVSTVNLWGWEDPPLVTVTIVK